MAYSRRMAERARALRRAGLTVMEITEILGGPGKTSVWRWIRDVRKPAGRAGGGMDLPRLVGDGPDYPDIDPEDKDALIERLRLENAVLRAVQDVLKAESLDGMSNREKTLVIDRLRPAGKWSLRELTGFLRISRSSYDYQRRAIARPDRLAPLRDVVRRVFLEDGDGARGYRFVVRRLRELDDPVRVSEKVVRRIMREEGLVPRWMRRRAGAYSSYGGEVTPRPAEPRAPRLPLGSAELPVAHRHNRVQAADGPQGVPVRHQGLLRFLGRRLAGGRAPGRRPRELDAVGRVLPAGAR